MDLLHHKPYLHLLEARGKCKMMLMSNNRYVVAMSVIQVTLETNVTVNTGIG